MSTFDKSDDQKTERTFSIKGIGAKKEALLIEAGIDSPKAMVKQIPSRYQDRTVQSSVEELEDGVSAVVELQITRVYRTVYLPGRRTIAKADASDETGSVKLIWFNQPYATKNLHIGDSYSLYGTFDAAKNALQNPIVQPLGKGSLVGIEPIYKRIKGIANKDRKKYALAACDQVQWDREECFSQLEIEKLALMPIDLTYRTLHAPTDFSSLQEANRSLLFREYVVTLLALMTTKLERNGMRAPILDGFDARSISILPFSLTADQERTLFEILSDMKSSKPMNRLLQGDVGSGKTAVAGMALIACVQSGYQAAMMAPTESLARQHYEKLQPMFSSIGIQTRLLVGSTSTTNREEIDGGLRSQQIDVVIGTHTLFQKGVQFGQLGLVVTDEQHRFGVSQRRMLSEKGRMPHVLVLSATPIPRTLSLVLHGDLDVSRIVEKPPGRRKIETYVVDTRYEERYLNFIRDEVSKGHQCFIVCPRIEEDEKSQWSVDALYRALRQGALSEVRLGKLHGKMKPDQKEKALKDFQRRKTDVLISTTVIEVGIDIPNATVMCIYGAEMFGLAQLHQLRGRVGRSEHASHCILVCTTPSTAAIKRLKVLEETEDGFEIAKKDLLFRGEGDLYGTEQSGTLDGKRLLIDEAWMDEVGKVVARLYPGLRQIEDLPERMRRFVLEKRESYEKTILN